MITFIEGVLLGVSVDAAVHNDIDTAGPLALLLIALLLFEKARNSHFDASGAC